MEVVSNLLTLFVLIIVFMLGIMLVSNQSITFMQQKIDYDIQQFNQDKISRDVDSILNITEPVSHSTLAMLLADAIYYRKNYFEYPDEGIPLAGGINQYYNDCVQADENGNCATHAASKLVWVEKFVKLVFDKMYGSQNYFLEIKPKIAKLRLYFVLDGSPSLENESKQLLDSIPQIVDDFNSAFDVAPMVYVLAGEVLMSKVNPCNAFKLKGIDCKYVYKEELYTDAAPNGWLTLKFPDRGELSKTGAKYYCTDFKAENCQQGKQNSTDCCGISSSCQYFYIDHYTYYSGYLQRIYNSGNTGIIGFNWCEGSNSLEDSTLNDFAQPKAEMKAAAPNSDWFITNDEFLDEQYAVKRGQYTLSDGNTMDMISSRYTMMWCGWVNFEEKPSQFGIKMDFAGSGSAAKFWVNGVGHNVSAKNHSDVNATADINAGWNKICFGYWPSPKEENMVSYAVKIDGMNSYFSLDKVFAFKRYPKEYSFMGGGLSIEDSNGTFYEDWATGSVYAATVAEKETPSVFTAIIPISDELATGSENDKCFKFNMESIDYGFCMACNKINNENLACPTERADKDTNRAAALIKDTQYIVYPVLANSCDISDWMGYPYNGYCRAKGLNPMGCGPTDLCGQCFGSDVNACPGLTLENNIGCDKAMCRDAIKEDMNYLATETYGSMIELTQLDQLEQEIEGNIKKTIEKFTIRSGTKRPNDERFSSQRVVPLSNRLYADLVLWLYREREQD